MARPQHISAKSRKTIASLAAVMLAAAVAVGLWAAFAGAATTLTVTTTADTSASGGACGNTGITTPPSPLSLREATCLANNIGGEVKITLPAGTYKLSNGELLPGKAPGQTVNITGAGAASTIIDGQGLSRVLNIDAQTLGNIKSTLTALTITGGADSTIGAAGILDGSNTTALPDELTLESVTVTGNQANAQTQTVNNQPGGGLAMIGGHLVVNNSTFTNNGSYSSPGSALAYFSQGGGGSQSVKISNSTFSSNHATNARTGPNGGAVSMLGGTGSEITESHFTNNDVIGSNTGTVLGAAIWDEHGNLTLTRSTFTGNSVSSSSGTATGAAIALSSSTSTLTLHYNRIVGNTPTGSAVASTLGSINATENWWGCNTGPGTAGCDGTSGTVTSSPYLKFSASASPSAVVRPNGTSTLTAGFPTDSSGATVPAGEIGSFGGTEVTWKEPTPAPATINGSTGTTKTAFSAGKATATYNSQSAPAGAGGAVAALDNASISVPVAVDQEPAITQNPSNQTVTPGATATFTAAASGTPTPSVQWQRSTDNGASFTNIAGATSTTYSFTAASGETGNQFRAVFTNTIEAAPYTATTTAATLTVGKATTTLSSTATNATLGGAVHDTATLSGGSSPTGSIIFNAYGPNDATCTGAVAFTKTVTVSGNGEYGSTNFTATAAGDYRWTIEYSGDANNKAATSACNATNEKSTVAKVGTTLSSTASSAPAPGPIKDTATLAGGSSPTGNIVFTAYGPNDASCTGAIAFTKTVAVSGNGSYGSTNFSPASAGEYRWTASYSGDANNEGSTSACNAANETSTVSKVTPTLSTAATDAAIGGAIHDTAELTGGVTPGGSIEFKLYGPNDAGCTAAAIETRTVAISGNGEYGSGDYTPALAGSYTWKVVYSGDANNQTFTSPCGAAGETSQVSEATPTISTTATNGTLGGSIHDTATLAGGQSPVGILTFKAYGPGDSACAGGPAYTKFVAVSGNGNYGSENFTPTKAGEYHWVAEYSGDGNNEAVASACEATGETSTVAKASPTLSTAATDATVGSPIHDTATIAAGVTPGGSITFKAYGPGDATCANAAAFTATVAVSANASYASGNFTPSSSGSYRWSAEYSGDANNNSATSACNASGETSQVTNATPTLSTTATNAAIGSPVHDTATLAGGVSPGGTITFKAYGPSDATCATTAAFNETVTVTGNGAYPSPDFTPTTAGSYNWTAEYSGDANNQAAASACGASGETSTISQATPTISTAATSAKIGNPVNDTATLAGGHGAGGTIEFKAYGPNDASCTGTPAFSETVTVSGDGTYPSPDFNATALGEYRWTASYSGDTDNAAVASACGGSGETSTVTEATPTLSATATPTAAIGDPIHDTATLAGAHNPGGTIDFKAYGPDDATCAATPAYTKTVTVSGNGSYGSADFTPALAGKYRWTVAYSGDTDNEAAASACNAANQSSIVAAAAPTLATSATDAVLGNPVSDTATLAGGQGPTGTIEFKAYPPGDTSCARTPAYTKTVSVAGNGTYGSGDFTPSAVGAYRWVATYSGDANNTPADGQCGDAGETSTVSPVPPVTPTQPPGTSPAPPSPTPGLCTAPGASANGYVPKEKVKTGLVPGVRARISVAKPSNLQIAATLHYRLDGKAQSADLGSVLLEDPGARNLRLALPSGLRESLPVGTKVRLALQIAAAPIAGSPCSPSQHRSVAFKTKVVRVLVARQP